MKILVVGSGGREHALVWKISQSSRVTKIYCAPGNGGIADLAECVPIKADDIVALADFAHAHKIDLTVVGPEVPLVEGIVDLFTEEGLRIFGPSRAAARLEGSKMYAKSFMKRWDIPTAGYAAFTAMAPALEHLKTHTYPLVVKASGLAAGKGVIICSSRDEAERAVRQIMGEKIFKEAGNCLVIEEFLRGEEVSVLAVSDGVNFKVLESAQDHKRVFDNDEGPNTGGMGAYSPAPVATADLLERVSREVLALVIHGMADEGAPFKGVLYAGIMVTPQGPRVLEFNTRFGDPETQAILPRLKSDLVELMLASIEGRLADSLLEWDPCPCVSVVMAAGGYPGEYKTGQEILGLNEPLMDAVVFHAGTRKERDIYLTTGGRVLAVTAWGPNVASAIRNAYLAAEHISFPGAHYRRDIGRRALQR